MKILYKLIVPVFFKEIIFPIFTLLNHFRLLTDPKVQLDMAKTLENVGTATRTTFEHEETPMYHVRNMAGSAKDAVMAAMKIPNQNFLIPSKYDVIDRPHESEMVGAINPRIASSTGSDTGINGENTEPQEDDATTFNKVL